MYEDIIHTETNLSPDMHTPKLGLNSFNVLRKDRSSVSSAKESGGGVLVAVSNIYRAYEFVSTIDNVECWLLSKLIVYLQSTYLFWWSLC